MESGTFTLIAGLGNPGSKYLETRHNIGFMALEKIAKKESVSFTMNKKIFANVASFSNGDKKQRLLMPNTFMNESGRSIKSAIEWFGIEKNEILILVDDMDLPLGTLRLRTGGSSGGHNGLKNIISHLGTDDFCRLRIGIGSPSNSNFERKRKAIPHVLGQFDKEEERIIGNVLEKITNGLDLIKNLGLDKGVTYLNTLSTNLTI